MKISNPFSDWRLDLRLAALVLVLAVAWWLPVPGIAGLGGTAFAQTCPSGSQVKNVGTAYKYRHNGNSFLWSIYRRPGQTQVGYRNERSDGSWSQHGTINRWPKCPAAKISVQVIDAQGKSTLCSRVCLPDGREELHCPNVQLVLSRLSDLRVCVNSSGSTIEPGSPAPVPRACRFRFGCMNYTTCVSCAGADNSVLSPWFCLFAGGDLGSGTCEQNPFPPGSGGDDPSGSDGDPSDPDGDPSDPDGDGLIAPPGTPGEIPITCVPIPGYPYWCDREFPGY